MDFKIRYQASRIKRFTARHDEHTFDITAAGRGADFDNSVCIFVLNFSARSRDVKLPKATTPESLSDWISPAAIGN